MKNKSLNIMKYLITATAIMMAFISSSCSTLHHISSEEISPDLNGKVYSKLLTIGKYSDKAYRTSAEVLFTEVLKSKGVNADPSYNLLPQLDDLENNKEAILKVKESNYDGVLIVATLDEGYDYDIGDYYATRGMVYLLGGEPGTYTDIGSFIDWAGSGQYKLYVGLWDVSSLNPVWQITTKSETSGSESEDNKALAELIANQLLEKGLIK